MKKENIYIGQSLNIKTGELSNLSEHENVFSGNILITGATRTGKEKLVQSFFYQFSEKEDIDIFFIDIKGSQNQEYIKKLILKSNTEDFNITYSTDLEKPILEDFNKYNKKLNELNFYDFRSNKNVYFFQTFPILNRTNSEIYIQEILNLLIERASKTIENASKEKKIKKTLIIIPNVDVIKNINLENLFLKAGGLGFKIILSTEEFDLDYIHDYVYTNIFFKIRNKDCIEKIIKTIGSDYELFTDYMKLENLKDRMFLYVKNKTQHYCLAPFIK